MCPYPVSEVAENRQNLDAKELMQPLDIVGSGHVGIICHYLSCKPIAVGSDNARAATARS